MLSLFRTLVMLVALVIAAACGAELADLLPDDSQRAVNAASDRCGGEQRCAPVTHRIQVRPGATRDEFFDVVTGARFMPRGNNYIRLGFVDDPWNGEAFYHSTFDAYDVTRVEIALGQMQEYGYNLVRAFIDEATVGNRDAPGLSEAYVANVADFLRRAQAHGVYTILTFAFLPKSGGYFSVPEPLIGGYNTFLLSAAAVAAKGRYLQDFIRVLDKLQAPRDAIFSYNIENEVFFTEDELPLSLASGLVTTANGGSYDLSQAFDRQQLMDANLVFWINSVRAAVHEVDPTALVAPGFFAPSAVDGSDPRVIRTYWALANPEQGGSSADYIDLHTYPGPRSLEALVADFEIGVSRKALLLGEFGAPKAVYANVVQAALAMRDWQVESCRRFGFSGWALWTWDTVEQPEFFNLLESQGAMNGVLAPIVRPDPCAY